MKKLQNVQCGDDEDGDEMICLEDSGSNLNGIDVAKVVPEYLPHRVNSEANKRGGDATCASGTVLEPEGQVKVQVEAGGQEFEIGFCYIKTHMPILSVRRMVKNKNRILSEDYGGHIEGLETGTRIPFFQHDGVHFLKLKIEKPATPSPVRRKSPTGFAKPGP